MFSCVVCGRGFATDTEVGNHLRIHGVNLFPEVVRLGALVNKVIAENKRLVKENEDLKGRLRLVLP